MSKKKIQPITTAQRTVINELALCLSIVRAEKIIAEKCGQRPDFLAQHLQKNPKAEQLHSAFTRAVTKQTKKVFNALAAGLEKSATDNQEGE